MDNDNILNNTLEIILASTGGMVSYFLKYYKEKELNENYKFSFVLFFINMILGGFVGHLVGTVIGDNNKYHDFIIGMSGIASYPLLLILEGNFLLAIEKYFGLYNKKPTMDDILKAKDDIIKKATGPGNCTPQKPKDSPLEKKLEEVEKKIESDTKEKILKFQDIF